MTMASSPANNTKKRSLLPSATGGDAALAKPASNARRASLPSTIPSSTVMTKDKVVARRKKSLVAASSSSASVSRRRSSITFAAATTITKENRTNDYSPPETRSAKKRRTSYSQQQHAAAAAGGLLLTFSPPNQKENARREKEEREKRERARAERVRSAQNDGQLLVYDVFGKPIIGLPVSSATTAVEEKPPFPPAMLECIRKRREQETIENEALLEDVISLCNNNEEVDELKKEIVSLEAKITVFETESETTKEKLKSLTALQKSQEELKLQNDSMNIKNTLMGQQLVSLETKLKEANEQLIEQKIQLQELQQVIGEVASLQSENQRLQATISALEKKVRYLENVRIPELQILLNSEKDNVARFESEMDTLQSELEKDQGDQLRASQQQRIEVLEQEVQEHKCTIEANHKTIADFGNSLKNAEDRFDADRKTLNDALEDALEELRSLERVKNALKKKVDDTVPLTATVETLNRQIADDRSRLENSIVSKDQKIRLLEQQLRQVTEDRDQARSNMQGFDDRENELYRKLHEGELIRRQMHGRIMQLMGNIRVFVRVRPQLQHEADGNPTPFSFPGAYDGPQNVDLAKMYIEVKAPHKDRGGLSERRTTYRFGFDKVFGPNINQDGIWEAVEPLIQCAVDGSAVTLFAYGQTGSGKTHTMLGGEDSSEEGIIGRSVRMMFEKKVQIGSLARDDNLVNLSVEVLEVYNEKAFCLINKNDSSDQGLKVTQDGVDGNRVVEVNSLDEVIKILRLAQKKRCVKQTDLNATSSRSHLVFTLNFKIGSTQCGKLNICDLAGSERIKKSGVQGQRLEESKNINTSLSCLSNVIECLQTGSSVAPFRNSKLTMLLKSSLTGDSKTLAIVCCSPSEEHFDESVSSLRFAEKAARVELKSAPPPLSSKRKSIAP